MVGLDWSDGVVVDKAYVRPADNSTKAAEKLGWKPTIAFGDSIREMVEHDLTLEGLDPVRHLRKTGG